MAKSGAPWCRIFERNFIRKNAVQILHTRVSYNILRDAETQGEEANYF
jgi:hypothetical protein